MIETETVRYRDTLDISLLLVPVVTCIRLVDEVSTLYKELWPVVSDFTKESKKTVFGVSKCLTEETSELIPNVSLT